jgi:integrase
MPREREEWTKVDRCIWFCPQRKAAGNACYKADVNREGQRRQKIRRTLAAARKFRNTEWQSIEDTGELTGKSLAKNTTVEQAIEDYINEVILEFELAWVEEHGFKLNTIVMDERIRAAREGRRPKFTNIDEIKEEHLPKKRGYYILLKWFLKNQRKLCAMNVFQVKGIHVLQYARWRVNQPFFGPDGTWKDRPTMPGKGTLVKDLAILRQVFEHFRLKFPQYPNPWTTGTEILGRVHFSPNARKRKLRRLEEGELELLLDGCKNLRRLNKYYLPAAIFLSVETGMRKGEILKSYGRRRRFY